MRPRAAILKQRPDTNSRCDAKKAVEEKYGPWTAHNISLGNDAFTISNTVVGDEVKLRRVLQIVSDVCDRPIGELRILDLACLEGLYGIEFSRRGAQVCAIEGREASLEKARFAARTLSLRNIEFQQGDVRSLSEEKYGTFDVVLCLGILYHLDAPDVFTFLENVFAVCRRVAIIDTHISQCAERTFFHNTRKYSGKAVSEHAPSESPEKKRKKLWASLDNPVSAYFTRPSLYSLLFDLGFTSVYECHVPQEPHKAKDRATFVAIKGMPLAPVICPQLSSGYARELPEEPVPAAPVALRPALAVVGKVLPQGFKRWVRRAVFAGKPD